MKNTNTLSIKKPVACLSKQNIRPDLGVIGKHVVVQTKSPSQITGVVESIENGWVCITGFERRWLSDGSISDVVLNGRFTLDRNVITYFCEVV